ncbi:hypothetical protein, partial [Enterobacter hormaechei]|uniref:hypothetical protein n=1 Tax=Enterobacter hormaechei TaxID=158836 RepID=UPI001C8BD26F
ENVNVWSILWHTSLCTFSKLVIERCLNMTVIIYSACCEKNSLEASRVQNGEGFLLPLVTNRKTPAHEIWGSFKVHVHFTCIFLSFLGLPAVWSVSVSGCFYFHCPVAVLSKVVELAGVEPASEISTYHFYYSGNNDLCLKTMN